MTKKILLSLLTLVVLSGVFWCDGQTNKMVAWGYGGSSGGSYGSYPTNTSVVINAGALTATSRIVTLALGATNATQMAVSEDSGLSGASWQTYSSSLSFTLSAGNGAKTVYARYKSADGLYSGIVSDTITLNEIADTNSNTNANTNTNGNINTNANTNSNSNLNTNSSLNTNSGSNNSNQNVNSGTQQIVNKVEIIRGGEERKVDLKLEREGIKVFSTLTKALPKGQQWEVIHWVAYGDENSDALTLAERKAALADYYSLYGKLPVSDAQWVDLLTIAGFGGEKPKQRNLKQEIVGIGVFRGIYKKLPSTSSDWKFVNWIAYRMNVNPASKDALKEKKALAAFNKLKYAGKPLAKSSLGQAIIRALAYAGL